VGKKAWQLDESGAIEARPQALEEHAERIASAETLGHVRLGYGLAGDAESGVLGVVDPLGVLGDLPPVARGGLVVTLGEAVALGTEFVVGAVVQLEGMAAGQELFAVGVCYLVKDSGDTARLAQVRLETGLGGVWVPLLPGVSVRSQAVASSEYGPAVLLAGLTVPPGGELGVRLSARVGAGASELSQAWLAVMEIGGGLVAR
jgi:hypothetical protein